MSPEPNYIEKAWPGNETRFERTVTLGRSMMDESVKACDERALDAGETLDVAADVSSDPSLPGTNSRRETLSTCVAPKPSKEWLRLKLYAVLMAVDAASLSIGFALANALRHYDPFHSQGREMLVVLLTLFIGIALNGRAYSIEVLKNPRLSSRRAVKALMLSIAILIALFFYLKASENFSRIFIATGSLSSIILVALGRRSFGSWIGDRHDWSFSNDVLLIDGKAMPPINGEVILNAEEQQLSPRLDDPALLHRLGKMLENCDKVLVSCVPERRADWAATLRGTGVDVEVLVPELEKLQAITLRRFGARTTALVGCGPLGLRDRALKRALDLAIAVPTWILLAPLMVMIALAIKLESPGPVVFRQPRVGRGNRIFQVLKFRSMRADMTDQDGTRSTARADNRVTRLGSFLRRTSLDELPQLLNVIAGDMSIVGPRPHALASRAEDELFWHIDPRYWDRHAIKPGMTGLAQIRGYRGATASRGDLTNRLQADLEYLSGWTLSRDLGIIFRTLTVMVHRNAF